MDWSYLNLLLGKNLPFASHTLSVEAGGQAAYFAQRLLFRGKTLGLSDRHRLSPRFDLETSAWARERRYIEYDYLDGWVFDYAVRLLYAPSTTNRWEMQFAYTDARMDDALYAYRSPVASVRYVKEWPGGWITGLRVHSAKVQFEQRDPLFDVLRRDTERGVEFDVINRRWSWQGFTPQLVYGVKRHDSNLELYSFDRRYVRLGVSKQF